MKPVVSIYALSLLRAAAAANCGVEGGTTVIANPNYQILDELETCSIIYGNILIDPGFIYFILNGPREITGTITAHNNLILKSFSLPDARKLGGISFVSPDITGRFDLPELTEIGNLEWKDIIFNYEFDYMIWNAPKLTAVSNLNVEHTWLSGFLPDYPSYDGSYYYYDGLVNVSTADSIRVVNNQRMNDVIFPGLKTVSGPVIVGNNIDARRITGKRKRDNGNLFVSFPALESAGSIAIYDKKPSRVGYEGKVNLPVLDHVSGDFNVTDIDGINEIYAPVVTDIAGGLYIMKNKALKIVEFPELRRADHIVLEGGRDGFRRIEFPVLEQVRSFHVNIPSYTFDCSLLDHIRAIASEFSCRDIRSHSGPSGGPSSGPPTPTASHFASPTGLALPDPRRWSKPATGKSQ